MQLHVTGSDTVAGLLARWAEAMPGAPALVFEDADADPGTDENKVESGNGATTTRTYGEVFERARRAAAVLSDRGIGRGDRVHLHMANRPEFFDAWFGCAVLGAVMVPTNPLLTVEELAFEIEHSGARLSIAAPDLVAALGDAPAMTTAEFERALEAAPPTDPAGVAPTDPLAILYTSGTTSRPKGVVVTHANYLYAGEVVAQHLRIRPEDRWLVVLPLFHANAQYYSTMSALVSGASVAVMPRFSASRWGAQAARHSATLASLFAAPIRMILAGEPQEGDRSNALRGVIFSQNVTEEQLAAFEERFGAPLMQLYGMTETIAPPTLNPAFGRRRNMSIGRPTLPARVRLVDESGADVPGGTVGEIVVGGDPGVTLMAGYLNDPEATSAALRDGWLHTGDLARADDDGYLYFVDRAKDMIKRAGENVSAGEVEAVANRHPAIHESAAIGVEDAMRDEAIHLYCVLRAGTNATEADILAWCTERLARFKVPSAVSFVSDLPRTSVGKVAKERLRRSPEREG